MIVIDINHYASLLIVEDKKVTREEKISIMEGLLEAVVGRMNNPVGADAWYSEMVSDLEMEYNVFGAEEWLALLWNDIWGQRRKFHWDPRLQVKLSYLKKGRSFNQAIIQMDLDATLFKLWQEPEHNPTGDITSIAELVSDNPNLEALNAIDRSYRREVKVKSVPRPPRTKYKST